MSGARPRSSTPYEAEHWERARARCLRVARSVLRHGADAEDAAQEALLRAWRSPTAATSEEAWLSTIARNEALRIAGRRRPADALTDCAELAVPGDLELEALSAVALDALLSTLSAADRRLLELRYMHDLTQPEIARAIGVPEGTVKVRLHRLRLRLRSDLRNEP